MLSTARARLPVRNAALFLRPARLTFRRHKSKQVPTPWQKESVDEPMSTNFAEHTMFTIDFFVRFFKFSLVGLAALGLSTWTAFEGTHMWVEMVGLAPEKDEDVRRWEWHKEAERWLGREDGGTDPALGFKGRHAVRGAWMSLNWGIGSASSVLGSKAFSGQRPGGGGLNIVDARLEVAQDFMSIALRIAKERSANGKVRKDTVTELLARHASLLERMGTKDALFESRAQYERVWDAMGGRGIDAARVALKLGDLNSRLGDGADALVWWGKCMQLSQADASASSLLSSVPIVPKIFPSSPFAQRTLISSLISLSAYYATSGQLRQAQSVEEHSLEVLSQLPTPESLATASAPQALHALFVLHRSALLSIHLAEVHYALRTPPQSSIQWLTRAAQSSERVALALTGLPLIHPDAPESQIPHPPSSETPLLPAYAKSMSMSRPATSLLRDARRSAAEAWNLAGILYEGEGETTTTKRKGKRKEGDVEKALECYERALGWAGVAADRVGNVADPGEGTLEAEWRLYYGCTPVLSGFDKRAYKYYEDTSPAVHNFPERHTRSRYAMSSSSVLKAWEACDKTDVVFILVCSVFCWPIIPAVGLGYSGYSTRRSALASFMPAILSVGCCTIQWFIVGYSLAYGDGSGVIGDLKYVLHRGVLADPVGTIPAILFSEFQLIFCATVCAISVGGICERGRILPIIPFIFLWATFIYCPLAHMVWSETGFLGQLGVLDFAGGTPVHICSGATATALSLYLSYPQFRSRKSSKRTPSHLKLHSPENSMCQLVALIIIWNSWLAFDAGTTLTLNFKSVMAMCVTNLCASAGAMSWVLMTYFETGKWSLDSTFMGAIAGLVMITPAAGFIDLTTSFWFGVGGAVICRQALRIKFTDLARRWRWVDNGDTFATHCVGGFVGTIATGLFARKEVAAYDGSAFIDGGVFFDGNVRQLGIQILEAVVGFAWSFAGSYILIALIDCVPGLEVLSEDEDVIAGMDAAQMEESLYEAKWTSGSDYHPFSHGAIELENEE